MNIERMKHVREFINSLPPDACDMTSWYEIAWDGSGHRFTFTVMKEQGFSCGTTACIAGWTAMLADQNTPHGANPNGIPAYYASHRATEYLELEPWEANALFTEMPDNPPEEGWKAWMIARLDDCIAAGHVTLWRDPEEPEEEEYDEEPEPEESEDEVELN